MNSFLSRLPPTPNDLYLGCGHPSDLGFSHAEVEICDIEIYGTEMPTVIVTEIDKGTYKSTQ